ncbi:MULTISPECIES: helix-turn-helix domain-containing protein [unclassified Erwinia]|nr:MULTISPECIES: helix-turn-helix domain-containing protein [unclassified Erwinia]PIJ80847.1 hypothetical protein BLD49_17015 [Erwinia sp. OLMDSP33]
MESELEFEGNIISSKAGSFSVLTEKERNIFILLMKEKGKVVSKSRIISGVWGEVTNYEDNLIQLIYRLRAKLKPFGLDKFVFNARREGYVFDKRCETTIIEDNKRTFIISPSNLVLIGSQMAECGDDFFTHHSDLSCISKSIRKMSLVLGEIDVILKKYKLAG